jgi:hypothetical protein
VPITISVSLNTDWAKKSWPRKRFSDPLILTNGGFAPSQFALAMILFEKRQFRDSRVAGCAEQLVMVLKEARQRHPVTA